MTLPEIISFVNENIKPIHFSLNSTGDVPAVQVVSNTYNGVLDVPSDVYAFVLTGFAALDEFGQPLLSVSDPIPYSLFYDSTPSYLNVRKGAATSYYLGYAATGYPYNIGCALQLPNFGASGSPTLVLPTQADWHICGVYFQFKAQRYHNSEDSWIVDSFVVQHVIGTSNDIPGSSLFSSYEFASRESSGTLSLRATSGSVQIAGVALPLSYGVPSSLKQAKIALGLIPGHSPNINLVSDEYRRGYGIGLPPSMRELSIEIASASSADVKLTVEQFNNGEPNYSFPLSDDQISALRSEILRALPITTEEALDALSGTEWLLHNPCGDSFPAQTLSHYIEQGVVECVNQ